jgi:Subtilase family
MKGKGVKIAILDTGIDLKNSWISSKAGRIHCWPSEDLCKDTDGHGTQVAHLILRLAPLVQLHIAKVSQSQLLQDADIKKIAEVRPIPQRVLNVYGSSTRYMHLFDANTANTLRQSSTSPPMSTVWI